ncbi:MAG: ABC transporter permease [Phycisphaeraceae bacterium]
MQPNKLWRMLRLGIKSLLLHKLRSALTMLGVVFGVGAVVAMLAVGEGASRKALEEIKALGSNNIMLTSKQNADDVSTTRSMIKTYGLFYEDVDRIRDTFNAVERIVPTKDIRKMTYYGERSVELRIVGTTPDWFRLVPRPIVAGRVLRDTDMLTSANVCVLTESGARKLLAASSVVNEHIRVGSDLYEVIGIVRNEQASGGGRTPDSEIDAYIPINVARERYSDLMIRRTSGSFQAEQVELHRILVAVRDIEQVEPVAAGIDRMMKIFHPDGDYELFVPLAVLRAARAQANIWKWTLFSIAAISLLVGGIGIMNIMLASVTERTREIGIRRAIGAKKKQIITQFLVETVVLSAAGGLIGTIVGPAIAAGITVMSGIDTIVPLYSILLAVGISMGIGIVFGLYPAVRAANLDPIVALRHD